MRVLTLAVSLVLLGSASTGVAAAAPPKCSDVGGTAGAGATCVITANDPAYTLNISFPTDFPNPNAVFDYVKQTRDGFINVAKTPDSRGMPYELDTTTTQYSSAVPPRGTQTVVFTTYQNVGGAHPQTFYKAFNWDQAYRKPITFETLFRPDTQPLPVIFPIVAAELAKQSGLSDPVSPTAGLDPANYQNFAITDGAIIFFFSQGELLPEAAGAVQVSVPRGPIDAMIA
jgi:hypothetical protein